jgi:hypothetical protein
MVTADVTSADGWIIEQHHVRSFFLLRFRWTYRKRCYWWCIQFRVYTTAMPMTSSRLRTHPNEVSCNTLKCLLSVIYSYSLSRIPPVDLWM